MSEVAHSAGKPEGGTGRRGRIQRLLVVLLVVVGSISLTVAPAVAGQARLLTSVFGAASSVTIDPYPLSSARGGAVDLETHDVYVVDGAGHRVEKFDSAGHFILMFGKEVDGTTGGDVCTVVSGDACQAGVAGSIAGGFERPEFVAVDNSGVFGQQGDVYVSDGEAALVSKFDPEGNLITSWGNNGEGHEKNGPANGQLNGTNASGTVKGPFVNGQLDGIAVDPSGDLWVNGSDHDMFEFHPDSSFLAGLRPGLGSISAGEAGIAVDSEHNFYVGNSAYKFDSTGLPISPVSAGSARGLTVDPVNDELYTVETRSFEPEPDVVARYDSSCHPTQEGCVPAELFRSAHIQRFPTAIAIDHSASANTFYVDENENGTEHPARVLGFSMETVPDAVTEKATGFTASSATLSGSVDPSGVELEGGLAGCRFEWGEHGTGEPEPYGHAAPCDKTAAQIGSGTGPVEVHATITGLQQGRVYHFRFVAGNHNQVNELIDEPSLGADFPFGPPSIENASAMSVGANSATMQAQVNPDNVETHVRIEYGTEAGGYSNSTPELDIGSGGTGAPIPFQLSGLAPHTVYHYRVVAENALGEGAGAVLGSDHTFVTQIASAGSALLDGRAWEMVSPPDKHGAQFLPISGTGMVQASAAGDAISYLANLPTEAVPAGNLDEEQILSRRTSGGWTSQDIAPPHERSVGTAEGYGAEYRFFSNDLSLAVVQPRGGFDPQISVEASEQTPYLRTVYASGEVESPCMASCYRPLVTGAAGYENVPPETVFAPECQGFCDPQFVGASQDASHVILSSGVALTEGARAAKAHSQSSEDSLYEWSAGKLVLVSVLPPNTKGEELPAPASSHPSLGEDKVARNAVSDDGSRVVWSDNGGGLYVRDVTRKETVRVGSGVRFQTASSDGSRVFFVEGGDLRECDIIENEGKLQCAVSDLTPVVPGESNAGVLGRIAGASEDGSYVYFVANAVLQNGGAAVPGAQRGGCSSNSTVGVTCNLYMLHGGAIKLVATLSGEDILDWTLGGSGGLESLTARVSPNGRWLAFMSDRSLTGYDNRDSVSGKPDEEVYLYDAQGDGGQGALACASCDPTGARPRGVFDAGTVANTLFFDSQDIWAGHWIAANIPGWTPYRLGLALYQSRYLSDSGRLFFNSPDALVPQDSNGIADVYEYEPLGVGDCTTASAGFSESGDGCVGLISSGTSKEESGFVDASEDGGNVFFLTTAQLSRKDIDSALDVYDARVAGGFAEASSPPVCEGDACQSPVAAPEDPTPGSLTYSGPGNPPGSLLSAPGALKRKTKPLTRSQRLAKALAACKQGRSKRARSECVRRASRRYGTANAGRETAKKGKR